MEGGMDPKAIITARPEALSARQRKGYSHTSGGETCPVSESYWDYTS